VTVRDIIELSKAGVPPTILTALIDADGTLFTLSADQVLELHRAGVDESVILRMLATARAATPATPDAPPATQAPELVIIGDNRPASPPAAAPVLVPYPVAIPVIIDGSSRRDHRHRDRRGDQPRRDEAERRPRGLSTSLPIRHGEFVIE
jgi:hypothetical protein